MNERNSDGARRGSTSLFLTVAFTGFGLFLIGVALELVPSDPDQIHAPRWVLLLVGAAFTLAGWLPVLSRADMTSHRFRYAVAAVVLCMLAVMNWAALHPERGAAHVPMALRPGLHVRLAGAGPVLSVVYLVVLDVAFGALALWLFFGGRGRRKS